MNKRDEIERLLRSWNLYEIDRGLQPIIDFDCSPSSEKVDPAPDRVSVYRELRRMRTETEGDLAARIDADIAYIAALIGQHSSLREYIQATQGCDALGWSNEYIASVAERATQALSSLGIDWGPETGKALKDAERPINADEAPDAIRQAAEHYEPAVRDLTGSRAPYTLTIESANIDAYWSYWIDGAGNNVRLRLNQRNSNFTEVSARQFALHEVLGHGLQSASLSAQASSADVPWVRLLSVHAPCQVTLEGIAQAMPLLIQTDDEVLRTRVRVDHFTQLVRSELHLSINSGTSIEECVYYAQKRVPWWTDAQISDFLTDRGSNPLLRSYLWAYPAGMDWFVALADADAKVIGEVLHAAYHAPLTPAELAAIWPDGPPVGGPGRSVRLRHPSVPGGAVHPD